MTSRVICNPKLIAKLKIKFDVCVSFKRENQHPIQVSVLSLLHPRLANKMVLFPAFFLVSQTFLIVNFSFKYIASTSNGMED